MEVQQAASGSSQRIPRPVKVPGPEVEASPAKKVRAAPEMPVISYPTPSPRQSFRVHIRPTVQFDITKLHSKTIQRVIDSTLGTTGYQGFVSHRASNSVTVHLATLEDAKKMCTVIQIPVSSEEYVPVQTYFASGPSTQRCVVYDLDLTDSPETVARELISATHTVLAARRMGNHGTFLITLQGPDTLPERFYYNGCIVRPKQYKPRPVHCYKCYRAGHLQSFCPNGANPDLLTATGEPKFRCGLCKTNDHDITSSQCPKKKRKSYQSRTTPLTMHNRFAALSPELSDERSEDVEPLTDHTHHKSSYATTLKTARNKKRMQPTFTADEFPELEHCTRQQDDIDQQIAMLAAQIEKLRQKKARIAELRKTRSDRQTETPACSTPAMVVNVAKCKPAANTTVWEAVLDTLAQLTHLIQNCLHNG